MTFPRKNNLLAAGAALAAFGVLALAFLSGGRGEAAFSVSACAVLVLPVLAASGARPGTLLAAWLGAALPAVILSFAEGLKGAAVAGAAAALWAGLCALASPVMRGHAGAVLTPLFLLLYSAPFWVKHVAPRLTSLLFRLSPFAVLASGSGVFDLRTHGMMYTLGPGTDYAFSMPSFWLWVLLWALAGGALLCFGARRRLKRLAAPVPPLAREEQE